MRIRQTREKAVFFLRNKIFVAGFKLINWVFYTATEWSENIGEDDVLLRMLSSVLIE